MTTPLYALIGFVFWTFALFVGVAGMRVAKVLSGQAQANDFPAGQPHGSDFYWRWNRAHANCLENLPLFAAVVLTAAVANHTSPAFDQCARIYMGARIGQSLTHIASGSVMAVNVRFTFFLVQLVSLMIMALGVVGM